MRTGAHGDILMGTPLLAALRRAWPDAHLTWIAVPHEADAIKANPYVDEYLLWDGAYWKKMLRRGLYPLWLARALAFRRELRRRRYDVFISLEPEHWPLLTKGVGAPISIGVFDTFRQWARSAATSPYTRFYTHPFTEADLPPHRTDQYLLPLAALGLPEPREKPLQMGYTDGDAHAAETFLSDNGLGGGKPFAVFAPLTNWPSRCWPGERYAELGDMLLSDGGLGVVIIGGARDADRKAAAEIGGRMRRRPALAVGGVLSFRQMAALVARADVLVSGDTGPMHVAAAVGTPYVALFGPTPVAGRAPLAGRGITLMHPVPCGPCDQERCPNTGDDHMRCLQLLSVAEVFDAVSQTIRVRAA